MLRKLHLSPAHLLRAAHKFDPPAVRSPTQADTAVRYGAPDADHAASCRVDAFRCLDLVL